MCADWVHNLPTSTAHSIKASNRVSYSESSYMQTPGAKNMWFCSEHHLSYTRTPYSLWIFILFSLQQRRSRWTVSHQKSYQTGNSSSTSKGRPGWHHSPVVSVSKRVFPGPQPLMAIIRGNLFNRWWMERIFHSQLRRRQDGRTAVRGLDPTGQNLWWGYTRVTWWNHSEGFNFGERDRDKNNFAADCHRRGCHRRVYCGRSDSFAETTLEEGQESKVIRKFRTSL